MNKKLNEIENKKELNKIISNFSKKKLEILINLLQKYSKYFSLNMRDEYIYQELFLEKKKRGYKNDINKKTKR